MPSSFDAPLAARSSLKDRVDANFPDSLRDRRRPCAENDLALIFVTAQFALDGDVSTLGKSGDELGQPAKCDTAMPLRAGIPRSGVILPRLLRRQRKNCDIRFIAGFLFGLAAEETDESNSVEVHTFLLFCPSVSGTRKRVGAAPKTRSCFSGGTGTGEPEPERCRRQSRSFSGTGRRKSPEAVPRQRVEQETDLK